MIPTFIQYKHDSIQNQNCPSLAATGGKCLQDYQKLPSQDYQWDSKIIIGIPRLSVDSQNYQYLIIIEKVWLSFSTTPYLIYYACVWS